MIGLQKKLLEKTVVNELPALFRDENNKKKSKKQETSLANSLLGFARPASGALKGFKGDVATPPPINFPVEDEKGFLVECKFTEKRSMSLKLEWIEKIQEEADNNNKHPAVNIMWNSPEAKVGYEYDWVMIPRSLFERLYKDV